MPAAVVPVHWQCSLTRGAGSCPLCGEHMRRSSERVAAYPRWEEALVELAALADPLSTTEVIARTLGLRDGPDQPILDRLLNHLRPRTLLLVLDNCEHLIDACAGLTRAVLAAIAECA